MSLVPRIPCVAPDHPREPRSQLMPDVLIRSWWHRTTLHPGSPYSPARANMGSGDRQGQRIAGDGRQLPPGEERRPKLWNPEIPGAGVAGDANCRQFLPAHSLRLTSNLVFPSRTDRPGTQSNTGTSRGPAALMLVQWLPEPVADIWGKSRGLCAYPPPGRSSTRDLFLAASRGKVCPNQASASRSPDT